MCRGSGAGSGSRSSHAVRVLFCVCSALPTTAAAAALTVRRRRRDAPARLEVVDIDCSPALYFTLCCTTQQQQHRGLNHQQHHHHHRQHHNHVQQRHQHHHQQSSLLHSTKFTHSCTALAPLGRASSHRRKQRTQRQAMAMTQLRCCALPCQGRRSESEAAHRTCRSLTVYGLSSSSAACQSMVLILQSTLDHISSIDRSVGHQLLCHCWCCCCFVLFTSHSPLPHLRW